MDTKFWLGNPKEGDYLVDLGIDGRIYIYNIYIMGLQETRWDNVD